MEEQRDRLGERIEIDPETGDWLWTGVRMGKGKGGRRRRPAATRFIFAMGTGEGFKRVQINGAHDRSDMLKKIRQ